MKILILVRHAKSEWRTAHGEDFDRPLNDRGRRDAGMMAERVQEKGLRIDHIVTSAARRARKTAKAFAERFDLPEACITETQALYHAESEEITTVVGMLPDAVECAALFGHNPGITDYVNGLGVVRIDEMPTCAVISVSAEVKSWSDFSKAEKRFLFFDRPTAG